MAECRGTGAHAGSEPRRAPPLLVPSSSSPLLGFCIPAAAPEFSHCHPTGSRISLHKALAQNYNPSFQPGPDESETNPGENHSLQKTCIPLTEHCARPAKVLSLVASQETLTR